MMRCATCQTENRDERRFCLRCGSPLQVVCPQCGTLGGPGVAYCGECGYALAEAGQTAATPGLAPSALVGGRHQVKGFLGAGSMKRVYLAHDTLLDRDVALSLIDIGGLDESARMRITREAQIMAKLGAHPNVVTIHDMGEHQGQPYLVAELMEGGDVEKLIEDAPEHRLPMGQLVAIAR